MSENTPQDGGASAPAVDPINNVKMEMERKINNVNTQMAQLNETNRQLLAQMQAMSAKPAPQDAGPDIEDLWYKDPKKAVEIIKQQTEASIEAKINSRQQEANRQSQTLSSLVKDFPELSDENNALTRRAVELYSQMDDYDKKSPTAYKLAVKEAAMELDVKPISKRAQNDDSYSIGSNSSQNEGRSTKGGRKESIAPETLAFAKLMGLDTSDSKVLESLKSRSQRRSWNKYE